MKLYSNQLQKISTSLKKREINSALFYGPDYGLIEYSISEISKILNITKRNISFEQTPVQEIYSILNNKNLFAEQELIIIKNMPSGLDSKTKSLLEKQHHNLLIFTSGELAPTSQIRKFFESEQNLASIACYNDDETSVEQIIRNYLAKENKKLEPDAMKYLKSQLHGDRFIVINELEKLFCYSINKNEISLEDVEDVIQNPSNAAPDKLCLYFMLGSKKSFFQELDQAIINNIPSIWVIRAITRYYINAYSALHNIKEGMDLEQAISSIPNQIFFKYKPAFKKAITILNRQKVQNVLENLYKAEKEIKSGNQEYKEVLLKCFFNCM